ncbi:MAG TPA: hypothetical protein VKG05_00975 [Steroidobacteraceae bacterium]|nr:hypothetical protein [Steroidobacteraceae bacterium]
MRKSHRHSRLLISVFFAIALLMARAQSQGLPASVKSPPRPQQPSSLEQRKNINERHLAAAQKWKSIIESYVASVPGAAIDLNSLADSLGKPESAFEFVRDQVALEPYPGAMKRPVATLVTRGGNDLDRSLLLANLLSLQGLEVQLAHGQLSVAQAQSLLQQIAAQPDATELLRRSIPPPPNASSPLMRQIGAFPAAKNKRLAESVEQSYALLDSSLKGAKITVGLDPTAAQLKSLQDHFWVRAVVDGKTVDLDPVFAKAEYGRKYADHAETLDLGGLDSARMQTVTLRLVAEYLQGGALLSQTLFDNEFNTVDLWGNNIRLAVLPNDAKAPANDFRAALSVGDDLAAQQVFQLRVTPADKPNGPQGNIGLWGGLVGGTTGAEEAHAKPTGAMLARLYLEIETRAPQLSPVRSRRIILDRLASGGGPPRLDPAMAGDGVAGALLSQVWDGAIGVGTIHPAFLAKATLAWIGAYIDVQNSLLAAANSASPLKPSDLPGPLLSPELLTFFLSSGNAEHQLQTQFAPLLRAYHQRARVAFFRHGFVVSDWADASKRVSYREGIDVVNSPFGFAGPPELQARLAMRWGAADTALELRFSQNGGDAFNTLPLIAAANAAKVATVTIGPDQKAAVAGISVPAPIKAVLERDLADERAIVAPEHLIAMNGTHTYGWWSIQRDTGYAIGKMELGGAQDLTEYLKLQQDIPKASQIAGNLVGNVLRCYMGGVASVLGGAASQSNADCVQSACCKAINDLLDMEVDDSMSIALLTEDEEEMERILKLEDALVKFDSLLPVTATEKAGGDACGDK